MGGGSCLGGTAPVRLHSRRQIFLKVSLVQSLCKVTIVLIFENLCTPDMVVVKGKTVVELGSGTGLVGMAALEAGAAKVIATDLPGQLPLLTENLIANNVLSRISVLPCEWGNPRGLQRRPVIGKRLTIEAK
jgi:predicted RNA methylase